MPATNTATSSVLSKRLTAGQHGYGAVPTTDPAMSPGGGGGTGTSSSLLAGVSLDLVVLDWDQMTKNEVVVPRARCCDLQTKVSKLECSGVHLDEVSVLRLGLILVSITLCQDLVLVLDTLAPRSRSTKVSRPHSHTATQY